MKNKMNVLLVVCLLAVSFDAIAGNGPSCSRVRRVAAGAVGGAVVGGVVGAFVPVVGTGDVVLDAISGAIGGAIGAWPELRVARGDIDAPLVAPAFAPVSYEEFLAAVRARMLVLFRDPELVDGRRISTRTLRSAYCGKGDDLMAQIRLIAAHEGRIRGVSQHYINEVIAGYEKKVLARMKLVAEAMRFEDGRRAERDARPKLARVRRS